MHSVKKWETIFYRNNNLKNLKKKNTKINVVFYTSVLEHL